MIGDKITEEKEKREKSKKTKTSKTAEKKIKKNKKMGRDVHKVIKLCLSFSVTLSPSPSKRHIITEWKYKDYTVHLQYSTVHLHFNFQ